MKYDFELDLKSRNSLSLLIERIRPNSIVLEFGPANGRMTKYLKEKLNCKIYAVELDEKAAKDVTGFTEKIIVDNIESYNWKSEFKGIKFDYIIFADVLEHLNCPEKALDSVRQFLKDDGSILISIPNIAHNAIILGLLKNEFNYNSTGLLDDTHIKFYTQKTFDVLVEKLGYYKTYETAVYISPKDTEFVIDYNDVPVEIGKYLSELSWGEMYQLIYEIKKTKVDLESNFLQEYKTYSKFYAQLFIDNNQGFYEDLSIRSFVEISESRQRFRFDLSGFGVVTNLRFDPLNESCVIEIDEITLITQDNIKIDLTKSVFSNACSHTEEGYCFETNDSQFYFEQDKFQDAMELVVVLKYKYIGEEALHQCLRSKEEELKRAYMKLNTIYERKSWKLIRKIDGFLTLFQKKENQYGN